VGNYNPHEPQILGQEWVPIRDEDLVFSPTVNTVEQGVTYVQVDNRTMREARFYSHESPDELAFYQVCQFNLYPAGAEDRTGPIKQVVIPVSAATNTGSNTFTNGGVGLVGALYQPGDQSKYVYMTKPAGTPAPVAGKLLLYFGVNQFPILQGKRILNVSLLYRGAVADSATGNTNGGDFVNPYPTLFSLSLVSQYDGGGVGQTFTAPSFASQTGALVLNTIGGRTAFPLQDAVTNALNLGDVNNCWDASNPAGTNEKLPWTYSDLQRFEFGAANGQHIEISIALPVTPNGDNTVFYLDYAALRVIFCEETRVAYGGKQLQYDYGMNNLTVRDLNRNLDPTFGAGTYLPTLSAVSMGQVGFGSGIQGAFPKLNAIREKYALPSHRGIKVNIPFPLEDRLGSTFTSESTPVLSQLSLHSPSAVIVDPHVYGRQAKAEVYGTVTAVQGILDSPVVSGFATRAYPLVRYYARRFGDTTVPLSLSMLGGLAEPTSIGSNATTPDNAALDITGDIDLRADMSQGDWVDGIYDTPISKWNQVTGNNRGYALQVSNIGQIVLVWSTDGINANSAFSSAVVPIISGRLAIRATMDVDNGAGSRVTTFYTAPTIAGPWTQLGIQFVTAGTTSIFSNAAKGQVGGHSETLPEGSSYIVHSIEIRNGINGTVVANPNFAAQPPGTTSFTDGAGRVWTINGLALITGSNAVTLTPSEWDALPDIVDGWKEINKRFSTVPLLGTGANPTFQWSASGESAGNRWEVLGCTALAITGQIVPGSIGNITTQIPPPHRLGPATYGQPTYGTAVDLSWAPGHAPLVTTTTADTTSDAVLILSQDPPAISGFAVVTTSMALTGIGQNCGIDPCCIPTALLYNRLTWSEMQSSALLLPGVVGSYATTPDTAVLDITGDIELRADVSTTDWTQNAVLVGKWPAGGAGNAGSSYRLAISGGGMQFVWSTTGTDLGVASTTGIEPLPVGGRLAIAVSMDVNNGAGGKDIRFYTAPTMAGPWTQFGATQTQGGTTSIFSSTTNVSVGANADGSEPFNGTVYSAQILNGLGGSAVANPVFSAQAPGTTSFTDAAGRTWTINGTASIGYYATDAVSKLELQRKDDITPTWQTIMLSTTPSITGFNDYEARVGIASQYRMRTINVLDFEGPWSSTLSVIPPAPGVSGGSCLQDGHLLLFTTNEIQSGASNLAYSSVWMDTQVREDFGFPEAGFVQMQAMYNRDFVTAFRPNERGGEQFSRTVLVQAAAISPPTLADFKSLRDMAWADVSYICVRDEDGNRWFATVLVPSGTVLRNRRLYLAPVDIIEVTDTPSEVSL
jgi:hypothetical protein